METLSRWITIAATSGGSSMMTDAASVMTLDPKVISKLNLWKTGLSLGRLAKALFDYNINN
jgi:hypothetical protein